MDQIHLGAWVGRSVSDVGGIDVALAEKLNTTVGYADAPAPRVNDLLPAVWHWAAFAPVSHTDHLSTNGYPASGALLPPLGLPRRM